MNKQSLELHIETTDNFRIFKENTMMTVEKLNQAYIDYCNNWKGSLRFGQYLCDQHSIEVSDSYYIEDDLAVYELILNGIFKVNPK